VSPAKEEWYVGVVAGVSPLNNNGSRNVFLRHGRHLDSYWTDRHGHLRRCHPLGWFDPCEGDMEITLNAAQAVPLREICGCVHIIMLNEEAATMACNEFGIGHE
jgi:hypothetical protein